MFSKLFGKNRAIHIPALIPTETDYSFGNAHAEKAARLLLAGDFNALAACYESAPAPDKSFILDKCCLSDLYGTAIETWSLQTEEPDFYNNLFHAVYLIYKAWQARSAAYASQLSDDEAIAFTEYLEEAYQLLDQCIEIDPTQPEIFARLIRLGMGYGDKETAQNSYSRLMQLDEGHVHGQMYIFNMLTPKWLGSEEEMTALTEQVTALVEQYPSLCVVILMHLAELYNIWSDDSKQGARKRSKKEILPQVNHWYQWAANRNDIHPQYRNYMTNYFAFLFYVCGENEMQVAEINKLNPNIPLYPWGYLGISSSKEFWSQRW